MLPKIVEAPAGVLQALHRHNDARLVVILDGACIERTLAARAVLVSGEFVVRPSYFAHDDTGGPGGGHYVRLGLSENAARQFFSCHGWQARRGRLSVDPQALGELMRDPAGGDVVLSSVETLAFDGTPERTPTGAVAAQLAEEDLTSLRDHAEACGWSAWTLTRQFARAYGMPPSRFRLQARLERALRLLAESDASLSAIAAQAGFADQSHFTHAMRRFVGETPSAVRRLVALG